MPCISSLVTFSEQLDTFLCKSDLLHTKKLVTVHPGLHVRWELYTLCFFSCAQSYEFYTGAENTGLIFTHLRSFLRSKYLLVQQRELLPLRKYAVDFSAEIVYPEGLSDFYRRILGHFLHINRSIPLVVIYDHTSTFNAR
jgi:hypothetical protein